MCVFILLPAPVFFSVRVCLLIFWHRHLPLVSFVLRFFFALLVFIWLRSFNYVSMAVIKRNHCKPKRCLKYLSTTNKGVVDVAVNGWMSVGKMISGKDLLLLVFMIAVVGARSYVAGAATVVNATTAIFTENATSSSSLPLPLTLSAVSPAVSTASSSLSISTAAPEIVTPLTLPANETNIGKSFFYCFLFIFNFYYSISLSIEHNDVIINGFNVN